MNLVPSLGFFVYRSLRFASSAKGFSREWLAAALTALLQVLSPEVVKLCGGGVDWLQHPDLVKMVKVAYTISSSEGGGEERLSPEIRSLCATAAADLVPRFDHTNTLKMLEACAARVSDALPSSPYSGSGPCRDLTSRVLADAVNGWAVSADNATTAATVSRAAARQVGLVACGLAASHLSDADFGACKEVISRAANLAGRGWCVFDDCAAALDEFDRGETGRSASRELGGQWDEFVASVGADVRDAAAEEEMEEGEGGGITHNV